MKNNKNNKERRGTRVAYIMGWILGIFFLIGGIMNVSDSLIGGLLIIFGAVLVLPPFNTFIEKKFKIKLSKWVRIGGFALLVLVGITITPSFNETNQLVDKDTLIEPHYSTSTLAESATSEGENQADYYYELVDNGIIKADVNLLNAFDALTSRNYVLSKEKALEVKSELMNAKKYYFKGREFFTQDQKYELNTRIDISQHQSTLLYKTAKLLEEKDKIFDELEKTESAEEIKNILPKLELLSRGYKENSEDWRELANNLQAVGNDPRLGISDDYIKSTFAISDVQASFASMMDSNIERLRGEVTDYIPVEERKMPTGSASESAPSDIISPDLEKFFDSFDKNKDNKLSIGEAQNFFFWVENNVQYRYDNENELEPIVGTIVGDNREGSDYRQKPVETLKEKAGDCEDMATLEQAFYRYYGIDAYVVGVNAEEPNVLDHAAAIIWISTYVNEFKRSLGDLVYYEIREGTKDIYGNPMRAGVYMLVDNSYSGAFGYLSGGIQAGTFKIHCAIPLEKGYNSEWNDIVSKCGVPAD